MEHSSLVSDDLKGIPSGCLYQIPGPSGNRTFYTAITVQDRFLDTMAGWKRLYLPC
jgi:hypothetical protein